MDWILGGALCALVLAVPFAWLVWSLNGHDGGKK